MEGQGRVTVAIRARCERWSVTGRRPFFLAISSCILAWAAANDAAVSGLFSWTTMLRMDWRLEWM